jgi:hypothetical protein
VFLPNFLLSIAGDTQPNSRGIFFTSTLNSFDPKRQKCEPSSKAVVDLMASPHFDVVKPLAKQPQSIVRVRRTVSVDALNRTPDLDESPGFPIVNRSRKSSRSSLTPKGITSRSSSISELNSKLCFGPVPVTPEDGPVNPKEFSPRRSIVKSKSVDSGHNHNGFFSITFDVDLHHSTHSHDHDKMKSCSCDLQKEKLDHNRLLYSYSSNSHSLPDHHHHHHEKNSAVRIQNPVANFTTLANNSEPFPERMTPILPFHNLSLDS